MRIRIPHVRFSTQYGTAGDVMYGMLLSPANILSDRESERRELLGHRRGKTSGVSRQMHHRLGEGVERWPEDITDREI